MPNALPPRSAFPWYLTSSSLWLGAASLHWIVVPWVLLGILDVSPSRYSLSRVLIEAPAVLALFAGGMLADRKDARQLLVAFGLVAALAPLAMAGAQPSFLAVVSFGVAVGLLQSLSDPARQSALSRVSRLDIQRAIVVATAVTSLVGIAGFSLGGQVKAIGLHWVLIAEALLFALAALAARGLPAMAPQRVEAPSLLAGFRALRQSPLSRDMVALNFASSLFNAGGYTVAMPFVATKVYGGDAAFLANMFIAFTVGSIASNAALYFAMPLLRPGRLFAALQLTRIAIIVALYCQPPAWLFFGLVFAWGLNMGVTSTLVRTTVQELAPAARRAQILAVLLFSFMVGAPISAALLGQIVAATDPLTALLPGIPVSLLICAAALRGKLWHYRSVSHPAAGHAA